MSQYTRFDKLTISFDTGPVPPPFCYRYDIKIQRTPADEYLTSLKLEYYDRNEITEDEIIDEGFSLDDDFAWEGKLPKIWGEEIEHKMSAANWEKKPIEEPGHSSFEIRYSGGGKAEILHPTDKRLWETFAQEIIQAIFELGKKEAPLKLTFLSIDQKKQQNKLQMVLQFSDRSVILSSTVGNSKKISWKEGQKLMKYIFFFDYIPEDSLHGSPKDPGNYLDPGDGFWYSFDETESKDKEVKVRWNKLAETLKSYL